MVSKGKELKSSKINKRQKIKIVTIAIVVFLLVDLSGLGGNIYFYSQWLRCGQKPVAIGASYLGAPLHYESLPAFSPMRFYAGTYFCSPRQAELAGYSASSSQYQFPHLTDAERRCAASLHSSLPHDDSCKEP